jgi:AcrR family transcriptional regulator
VHCKWYGAHVSTQIVRDKSHLENDATQYGDGVVHSRSPGRSRHSSSSATRRESKELTRQALLKAALKLLSKNSFDSISLREVTREAGITPTAFYRHFDDMEELGLVLVEDSFRSLRDMMRVARADPSLYNDALRLSIRVLVNHVHEHEGHMRFIARERHGGVRRLRRAIRRELELFGDELANDLANFPVVGAWTSDDRRMLAGLVVETMVQMAAELLEASPEEEAVIEARTERMLQLVLVGVPNWRSAPSP